MAVRAFLSRVGQSLGLPSQLFVARGFDARLTALEAA